MSFYFPRVRPELHTQALWQLRDIYDVWQADRDSWHEADTICLCIIPTLHLLSFPTRSIRQTVQQVRDEDGLGMRPDFKIGFYGNEFGIIEAKKVSTCLNAPHGYEHSYSPIDQTLRYFDRLGSRYAIATNGLEWIVFRQASAYAEEFSCKYEAIRINLQYTIKYYDPDLFDEFLYNFDYFRLMRGGWPSFGSSFQKRVQFQRNSGLVDVLMQDFSCDNEYVSS